MAQGIKVTALTIYPVKSLAGISVDLSNITDKGLEHDRRWMIVSPEGKFRTQRTFPKMALINTSFKNGVLTLSMKGHEPHQVPAVTDAAPTMDILIWNDELTVSRVSNESDEWISNALGKKSHLVYMTDEVFRQCRLDASEEGEGTSFSDAFPILIASEESLADLNDKLENPIEMRRFRPNIVIKGYGAFKEDDLKDFAIGGVKLKGVTPCSRCPLTMVDPDLGERDGKEPIRTLSTYRKWDNNVFFGMNVIQREHGMIKVGDELIVDA